MTDDSRYSPPAAVVADPALPSAPKRVRAAVNLLWTSLALAVPVCYLALARSPRPEYVIVELAIYVLWFAFVAFLNFRVLAGRNWARLLTFAFVLIGAYFVFFPPEDPSPPTVVESAINVICLVIECVAMWLLFTPPGAAWFKRRD